MWPGLAAEDTFFDLLASLWEHFGSLWVDLGASWAQIGFRLGSDWAQWLQIGVLGVTFVVSRLHFGWAWELLDALWGSLGVNLGASGIQNGCWRRPA